MTLISGHALAQSDAPPAEPSPSLTPLQLADPSHPIAPLPKQESATPVVFLRAALGMSHVSGSIRPDFGPIDQYRTLTFSQYGGSGQLTAGLGLSNVTALGLSFSLFYFPQVTTLLVYLDYDQPAVELTGNTTLFLLGPNLNFYLGKASPFSLGVTLGIAEFKIHEGDRQVFKDKVKSPASPKAQDGDGYGAELNLGFELFQSDKARLGLLASLSFFRIDLDNTTEEYQRWGESKRHLVSSLTIPSLRLVGSYF